MIVIGERGKEKLRLTIDTGLAHGKAASRPRDASIAVDAKFAVSEHGGQLSMWCPLSSSSDSLEASGCAGREEVRGASGSPQPSSPKAGKRGVWQKRERGELKLAGGKVRAT